MTVFIDAMGGDNAPFEIIRGAVSAVRELGAKITLIGEEKLIGEELKKQGEQGIDIIPSTQTIDMHEDPVMAVRKKKDSSMVIGAGLVKGSFSDAFISAGSTGALLATALLYTGRIKGIQRPAICTMFHLDKPIAVLDNGANADCKPEYFVQFAKMGSAYISGVSDNPRPKVWLLNIGAEESKGSALYKEAHELLKNDDSIDFIGNVEASAVFSGIADVIVCDGFAGNIFLKASEGAFKLMMNMLKDSFYANPLTKLGALLVKKQIYAKKDMVDPKTYGGSPFLGVNGTVLKAHGNSDALAVKNAVKQAITITEGKVLEKITQFI